MNFTSRVEQRFYEISGQKEISTTIPYITVDNFPRLGMFTALRFLEWVSEHPEGTISLPTGKTPEYFIRWTQYLLENWDKSEGKKYRDQYGLSGIEKPYLGDLSFVQIDEFFPINPAQHNSFYYYVNKFYIEGLGLDPVKALLINSEEIPLYDGMHFAEVFPDMEIDLSLRFREPANSFEQIQQKSVFLIDDWCTRYEDAIRERGGIGFFLGGIGPDGHIAFNTRGADLHSTTRLTPTNFETQAQAAGDLGGIEVSRNHLVITIGLETITYNSDAVAIVFAAGEAKAGVISDALENGPRNVFPATVLSRLENSRFYITKGAAVKLTDEVNRYFDQGNWTEAKTERAILELCRRLDKYAHHLTMDDLRSDPYCSLIPELSLDTVNHAVNRFRARLDRGCEAEKDQVFYHTGPHHDDIMLGVLPHIHRLSRNESNQSHFSILTSGFTAVTNRFIQDILKDTKSFLESGNIQMINYPDFFEEGYKHKWDKDVYHYLVKVASGEPHERRRGVCHRVVRSIVDIFGVRDAGELVKRIDSLLGELERSYSGEKNSPGIQRLKGMIREFEEELVWAHFGYQVKNVHHLRLGFYTGDIFTEQPTQERDVQPILEQLREIQPTVISLTMDPEGSGPDTHYKVLQAIAEAVRLWGKERDISNIRIWGYRNVWFRFHASEANVFVPVSLNAMAVMDNAFTNCYLSQVDASFPSYMYDGKFSELAIRIWVEQLKEIQLILGKDFFYQNASPRIRTTHGLLYYREMEVGEFLNEARRLEQSVEGVV